MSTKQMNDQNMSYMMTSQSKNAPHILISSFCVFLNFSKTFLSNIFLASRLKKGSTQETQPERSKKQTITMSSPVPRRISVTSPRGSTKDVWETPPVLRRPRSYTWSDCEDTLRSGHRETRRSVSVQLIRYCSISGYDMT